MYGKSKIIGQTITGFELDTKKTELILTTKQGKLIFDARGDCCSESWIEHINSCEMPATILSIEEKDMGTIEHDHTEYDCLQSYSTIFKTDKGDFEVEFRNDSNGYYGGSLELREHNDEVNK